MYLRSYEVPAFVTHYFPLSDGPLRNLSDLSDADAQEAIAKLGKRSDENPAFKRIFGPRYLDLRRQTETKMRNALQSIGIAPERRAPHYFVLGASEWFAGLYPETGSIVLPVAGLPLDQTTITYPDSVVAMGLGAEFGLPPQPSRPYHNRLFRVSDLPGLVSQYGLPRDARPASYDGYHRERFEMYVEVQLWTDGPVRSFLGSVDRASEGP
jgi:hypothetical protein